jgi:hypothetical protein
LQPFSRELCRTPEVIRKNWNNRPPHEFLQIAFAACQEWYCQEVSR